MGHYVPLMRAPRARPVRDGTLGVISGVLAAVRFDQTYELMPSVTAEKIALRDPGCVVVFNVPLSHENPENDPYADYPVPDDLMWWVSGQDAGQP